MTASDSAETEDEEQEYDHPIVSFREMGNPEHTYPYNDSTPEHVIPVRNYSVPNERLWAYRVKGNDEHVVVIDDGEAYRETVKKVPAKRTRVVPGEKLWTIPDNWQRGMKITKDMIAYGRYRIPETDTWVEVSIPTNDHVGDAWHSVRAVGELTVSPSTEVGRKHEAKTVLDERMQEAEEEWGQYDLTEEQVQVEREVCEAVVDNWRVIEMEHEKGCDLVESEAPWLQTPNTFYSLGDGWIDEGDRYRFRVEERIKGVSDISREEWTDEHDTVVSEVVTTLRDANIIPDPYKVEIGIDESAVDADYYDAALVEAGCSPPAAMDYRAVEIAGRTQQEWAEIRGIAQGSVSDNISDAKAVIGK